MLRTLENDRKDNWKDALSALTHAYNCTRSSVTGYSPYFLMFGRDPRLPIDIEFGLTLPTHLKADQSKYVRQLRLRLKWAHEQALQQVDKENRRQKVLYDRRVKGLKIEAGDRVLVRVCKHKGKGTHKIADRWEQRPYLVLSQPDPNTPVFRVQLDGDRRAKVRTIHRNLLLPVTTRWGLTKTPDPLATPELDGTELPSLFPGEGDGDAVADQGKNACQPSDPPPTLEKDGEVASEVSDQGEETSEEESEPKLESTPRPQRERKRPARFGDFVMSSVHAEITLDDQLARDYDFPGL